MIRMSFDLFIIFLKRFPKSNEEFSQVEWEAIYCIIIFMTAEETIQHIQGYAVQWNS